MKINISPLIAASLALTVALAGCKHEEIDCYAGEDAIFFDQHWGVPHFNNDIYLPASTSQINMRQTYSLVPFGLMVTDDSTLVVGIQTSGYIRDYDRPFSIEIVADSTTAIEGKEFELLERDLVIPAGQVRTTATVVCHRTRRMDEENTQVQLRILPGEHFVIPFGPAGVGNMPVIHTAAELKTEYGNNFDPAIHDIFINAFLHEPGRWISGANNLGVYSDKKFRILLDLTAELGWTVDTWSSTDTDQMNKMWPPGTGYMTGVNLLAKYLREQYDLGPDYWVLDPDGTMMWCRSNLVTWGEDTLPEEMIK